DIADCLLKRPRRRMEPSSSDTPVTVPADTTLPGKTVSGVIDPTDGSTTESADRPVPAAARRVDSVDLLRGAVIAIMLLAHTRDFVHSDALNFDPSDPA